jgi:hypothetical protein
VNLIFFLASQYVVALEDLHTIDADPDAQFDPRAVFERFLGWIPRRLNLQ